MPGLACTRVETAPRRERRSSSARSRSIAPSRSAAVEVVGRQPDAEAGLVDALRVVVLVPEDRERNHRLAEVEALRRRVVAAVRDDEVDLRQDRRLGEELLAPHVVRELELGVLRALRHDEPVRRVREHLDEAAHQLDVGRAEAAEREVDERALPLAKRVREVERRVRPADARVEPVPGRRGRARPLVVDLGGVEREVEPRRLVDQLAVRERRCTALDAEGGELLVQRGEDAGVLVPIRLPARRVGDRVARERRRQRGVLQLERVARDDPCPRAPGGGDRREADDVVLDHDVGLDLGQDLRQSVVDVARPVAERTERRLDELAQLVERRLAEDRCGLADEVLPELPRLLLGLRRRAESHQPLLEPLCLEAPRERLLDHEHDPVPSFAQHLPDADAVVRRPVGALGEEHDRRRLLLHGSSRSVS